MELAAPLALPAGEPPQDQSSGVAAIPQRVTVVPAPDPMVDLGEHLAFKLNHPHQVLDGADDALERFAAHVGEDHVSDEVRAAIR